MLQLATTKSGSFSDLLLRLRTSNAAVPSNSKTKKLKAKTRESKKMSNDNPSTPQPAFSVGLGLFLEAYIVSKSDELSQDQVDGIKSTLLWQQASHVAKKFETDEERQSHDNIMNNAIYLLDKSKDVHAALEDYRCELMSGFSKEKRQKQGSVYTPSEIIKWIHDKLEKYSPIDLNKTYFEPSCGTGRFVLDWYDRCMKHWEENKDRYSFGSREEAHKYIVEKCLYFADLDDQAIRLCQLGLFLKEPSVKVKMNVFIGNTLLGEPFKEIEKFDYIARNPPLQVLLS